MTAYLALERKFARRAAVQDALGILHWDSETMMPAGATACRAESTATLRGIAHDMLTALDVQDLLAKAESETASLDQWQRANLREMRRSILRELAVPRDLVEANSKAIVEARIAWREARDLDDFDHVQEPLSRVAALQRSIGEARGQQQGLSAYDALLDDFDPGLRVQKIEIAFTELRRHLPALICAAVERQAGRPPTEIPEGPFELDIQRQLAENLMRTIGFDFTRGRLDRAQQPFCGGASNDVRITHSFNPNDFLASMMALFHECGHALYEQGRPTRFLHQPVGEPRGLTVHESQALLFEMQVCSSRAFVAYLAQRARAAFGGTGAAWDADNLFRILNTVTPSLIRMDADEMTYVLHAIIRYDIEREVIAGDLAIADLPARYNDAVREGLGLVVPSDAAGCLQDIHWSAGLWGYFPSYALGAILAAQLFEAACRAYPNIAANLEVGEFSSLRDWLRVNVHEKSSLMETEELVVAATGKPLQAAPYLDYLKKRYVDSD